MNRSQSFHTSFNHRSSNDKHAVPTIACLPKMRLLNPLVCLFILTVSSSHAAEQIVRFGTGGSDGSYFPVGSVIASGINESSARCCPDSQLLVLPQRKI